jgi:hypothetical protein
MVEAAELGIEAEREELNELGADVENDEPVSDNEIGRTVETVEASELDTDRVAGERDELDAEDCKLEVKLGNSTVEPTLTSSNGSDSTDIDKRDVGDEESRSDSTSPLRSTSGSDDDCVEVGALDPMLKLVKIDCDVTVDD